MNKKEIKEIKEAINKIDDYTNRVLPNTMISKDIIKRNKERLERKREVALKTRNVRLANALLFAIKELNKLLEETNEQ